MKRSMRIVVSLALALVLSVSALAADELFPAVNAYPGLSDVRESADNWYYAPVKTCYETGLMMGTGQGFNPDQSITVAEVAAISGRLAEAITGQAVPTAQAGQAWYAPYITYLEANHGLTGLDAGKQATRMDFFTMLAKVTPDSLLTPINQITALPDTLEPDILKFYNAGILTGTDEFGTFGGDQPLTRAEAAAMIARLIRPELRQSFTPSERPSDWDVPTKLAEILQAEGLDKNQVVLDYGDGNVVLLGEFATAMVEDSYWQTKTFWDEQGYGDQDWLSMELYYNGVNMTSAEAVKRATILGFTNGYFNAQTGSTAKREVLEEYLASNTVTTPALDKVDAKTICQKYHEYNDSQGGFDPATGDWKSE